MQVQTIDAASARRRAAAPLVTGARRGAVLAAAIDVALPVFAGSSRGAGCDAEEPAQRPGIRKAGMKGSSSGVAAADLQSERGWSPPGNRT